MILVNLGCGKNLHSEWCNIDLISSNPSVVKHDLRKGIPLADNSSDFVYSSHLLEHFSKDDGYKFLEGCFRVLKSGGIIRVVVPDLEKIVREYLINLDKALAGNNTAMLNYDWIMLEMFDQIIREKPNGSMAEYLSKPIIENEEYVFKRIGQEGRNIRNNLSNKQVKADGEKTASRHIQDNSGKNLRLLAPILRAIKKKLFKHELAYINIGKFRNSGEIHKWMYDRYLLKTLLQKVGFVKVKKQAANISCLESRSRFNLDTDEGGTIRKPDSLFMEAFKPLPGTSNT